MPTLGMYADARGVGGGGLLRLYVVCMGGGVVLWGNQFYNLPIPDRLFDFRQHISHVVHRRYDRFAVNGRPFFRFFVHP